jgi:hypothetical protein
MIKINNKKSSSITLKDKNRSKSGVYCGLTILDYRF